MSTPRPLSEQLRELARSSGYGLRELARATEIDKAGLSRFLAGEGGLRLEAIDRLAMHLGVRLTARRRPSKRTER